MFPFWQHVSGRAKGPGGLPRGHNELLSGNVMELVKRGESQIGGYAKNYKNVIWHEK
jgi:hypothetical protein